MLAALIAITALAVLVTGSYQAEKPGETMALIGLAVGFGLGAIALTLEGFFVKGGFNKEAI